MISRPSTRPTSRLSRPVRWFFCGITTTSLGVMAAAAQQAGPNSREPLQQQVEELKQEYEANNRALLLRIATLEMQISQTQTSRRTEQSWNGLGGGVGGSESGGEGFAWATRTRSGRHVPGRYRRGADL